MRRKPRWQSGDVRNIDDCSENGINETFESNETYKPAGVDHHVSALKQWEASLPGVKLHGFVADLWKHFRQIGMGLNRVVVFWCHNSGTRRFGRLRGCPFKVDHAARSVNGGERVSAAAERDLSASGDAAAVSFCGLWVPLDKPSWVPGRFSAFSEACDRS